MPKKRKHRAFSVMIDTVKEKIAIIPENYPKPKLIPTLLDVVYSRIRYGTGIMDYFDYRFYSLNNIGRKSFGTIRDQFYLYNTVNDPRYTERADNKNEFYKYYGHLMGRKAINISADTPDQTLKNFISEAKAAGIDRLIFKPYNGGDGFGIFILNVDDPTLQSVKSLMNIHNTEIQKAIQQAPHLKKKLASGTEIDAEWVIENHPIIKKIHPSSLNTLRFPTLLVDGECRIQGAYIRFGTNGAQTDNIGGGGIGAEVDLDTGIVITPATDHTEKTYLKHPNTGEMILGLQIPCWEETKELVIKAAHVTPQLGYMVWDVALTPKGPVIIEGNALGGLTLQQFPRRMGKRYLYADALK